MDVPNTNLSKCSSLESHRLTRGLFPSSQPVGRSYPAALATSTRKQVAYSIHYLVCRIAGSCFPGSSVSLANPGPSRCFCRSTRATAAARSGGFGPVLSCEPNPAGPIIFTCIQPCFWPIHKEMKGAATIRSPVRFQVVHIRIYSGCCHQLQGTSQPAEVLQPRVA